MAAEKAEVGFLAFYRGYPPNLLFGGLIVENTRINPVKYILNTIQAIVVLMLTLSSVIAQAGVNLRNGNFYISYTDMTIALPAGITFELERTYNSKSPEKGLFGAGWGSPLDTFIEILGDGNIVLHENGSGTTTIFRQPVLNINQMELMVEQILIAMRRTGDLKELNAVPGQRQKLRKDEELRNNYWNRYVRQGLLEPYRPDMGAIFLNSGLLQLRHGATQRLVYLPDGFWRYQNDRVENFNRAGQLVRIQYPLQGFSLDLERDSQGRLQRLIYPNGALHFSLNLDGTVSYIDKIRTGDSVDNRLRSLYFYQDGNLTMSNDADMNNYKYQYDQNSNMLAITYVDNSTMRMTYNGDQHIRSITTRGKATTWYSYGYLYEENDREGYFTEMQRPDGSRDRYEEHTRRNAYGSWLKAKIRTTVAGVTTEAEYSPEGQLYQIRGGPWPVRIERDSLGRAILIAEDDLVTHVAYNADSRVTILKQQPVDAPSPTERRDFAYNADGRLIQITPSNGEPLTLNYASDCLTSLTLGNQKLEILCNDQKLPKTLRLSQYPTLPVDVVFDQWGDIESATAEPEPASTIAGLLRDVLRLTKSPIDLKKKIVGIECLECALPDLKELLVFPERIPLEAIIKQLEKPAP